VATLFLPTETAADFFLHLGYETIPRSEAPAEIVGTSQFACLCPASATLMRKVLKKESSVSVSH
jgi:N-acetylglutamate synthase-like GNAT family acetyltransferase